MTTAEMNSKLQILELGRFKFSEQILELSRYHYKRKICIYKWSGCALFIEGLGFLKFKDSKYIYSPRGGRKALKDIISQGGMINYDNIEFVQPI